MPSLTPGAEEVAQGLASKTGLDINVVRAWIAQESAWGRSPGDNAYNYLNWDHSSGEWHHLSTADEAVDAYYGQLTRAPQWYGRILASAGASPQTQISAIAASPWSASHYGGKGGPNLVRVYNAVVKAYAGGTGTLEAASASVTKVTPISSRSGKQAKPWLTLHIPGDGDIPLGAILKVTAGALLMLAALVIILAAIGLRSGVAGTAIEAVPGGSLVRRGAKNYGAGVRERRLMQNNPDSGATIRDGRRRSQFKVSAEELEASG